jgi:hypothetical protein
MLPLKIFLKLIVKGDSSKHLLVGKLSLFKNILQVIKFLQNWYFSMLFQGRRCLIHLVHMEEYFSMSPKMLPYNLFGVWVLNCITCVNDIMILFSCTQIIELKN